MARPLLLLDPSNLASFLTGSLSEPCSHPLRQGTTCEHSSHPQRQRFHHAKDRRQPTPCIGRRYQRSRSLLSRQTSPRISLQLLACLQILASLHLWILLEQVPRQALPRVLPCVLWRVLFRDYRHERHDHEKKYLVHFVEGNKLLGG
jgi:hypothetical protein